MKQLKKILLMFGLIIIPLCGMVLADDCFDTVIDENGKTFYIDPKDKYSVFEDREKLVSIYGDKLECSNSKKVYSSDEYMNLLFDDISENYWKNKSTQSTWTKVIEIIISILGCVAMWIIFDKAWKSWIGAIIPIYNLYELSDIAGLSWLFKKAFISLIAWIILCFFIPVIGLILIWIFVIYMYVVNYNVARNFWRSVFSSILYVIFNPIAILILAFWNYEYYMTEQKNKIQDQIMKKELENLVLQWINDKDSIEQNMWNNNGQVNPNSQNDEIKIKYIDPNDINW